MTEDLKETRIDLAAALRWAVRFDLHEGIDNHFTVMAPGRDDLVVTHPFGLHWSEIGPGDLIVVDREGRTVEGEGEMERTAFCIHMPIHRARADARCILHTHMRHATALAMLEDATLEMVSQNALRFHGRIAHDRDYAGIALDPAEGERLARALGLADVLFMANHGVLVAGPTVAAAFDDLFFLEKACEVQMLAAAAGRLKPISDHVVAMTARQMVPNETVYQDLHFAALKRLLAREAPEFGG